MFAVNGRGAKSNEEEREVVDKSFHDHIQPSMKYGILHMPFLLCLISG